MKLDVLLVEDFPYPAERVWRALTEPDALRIWLLDNDFEPRIGKRFNLHGREIPPRGLGWIECEVLELEKPHRMLWSWTHNGSDPPTRVEFRLQPIEGGTRLTLSHTGDIDPLIGARLKEGWPGKLTDLRALLGRAV